MNDQKIEKKSRKYVFGLQMLQYIIFTSCLKFHFTFIYTAPNRLK